LPACAGEAHPAIPASFIFTPETAPWRDFTNARRGTCKLSTEPPIQAAAVVYRVGEHDRRALIDFARELADGGCRLGGMVQEAFFDDRGRRTHIDSVDLATGDHIMINQPSRNGPDCKECTLDTAALTDAGAPLRRAIADRPDLVIAEKFGEQEELGAGLLDDILAVIAEGLPTLVLVPEPALPSWRELTAGGIEEMLCEAEALRRWWRDRSGGSS
jgi:nucleoside-triphosphatase THEP1